MKMPVFLKLFGAFLVVAVVLSVLILAFAFGTVRERWIARETARLESLARVLTIQVGPPLSDPKRPGLEALVSRAAEAADARITVVDPMGAVLADSTADARSMEPHLYRPEILAALSGQTGVARRRSPTIGQDMLYVGLPVVVEGRLAGVVRVSLYLRDIDRLLAGLRNRILRLVAAAFLVLLGGALLFSRHIARPVRALTAASRAVARGDFQAKVFIKNRDELRTLAESFNAMTLRLKALFEEAEAQRDELGQVIGSIREGLMVIGPDDRILMTNESCRALCRTDAAVGKYFWEVVRHPGFQELAARVKAIRISAVEEIVVVDKSFLASVVWVPARERRIVTFFDLTEVRQLERIKREFVTNISHELRTPLTAIKGFAEAFDPGPGEAGRRALDAIRRNTDRLIAIVQDLLILSGLEEKGAPLELKPVAMAPLLRDVLNGFEERARRKGIALILNAEEGLPDVVGDAFRLEQLFQNLLDNALKYTDAGRVEVSLRREGRHLTVEVGDSGIGVPEEHLPHIFERFYVVDKSRDKRLGGTGLGLAIAKHIALRHQGTIDVASRPGQGTVFTVRFPLPS
jgi:two-component system phosphate regulon sensor histidine kinase PhoR